MRREGGGRDVHGRGSSKSTSGKENAVNEVLRHSPLEVENHAGQSKGERTAHSAWPTPATLTRHVLVLWVSDGSLSLAQAA